MVLSKELQESTEFGNDFLTGKGRKSQEDSVFGVTDDN